MLLRSPVIWRGSLELRKRQVPIHLHLISGNSGLPPACIPFCGDPPVLKLQKTLKLPHKHMDDINRKTKRYDLHTILIGLPEVDEDKGLEALQRAQIYKNTFVDFLTTRGYVALAELDHIALEDESFTLHVFPHCMFAADFVLRLVPDEYDTLEDSAYLLFILTRNTTEK